MQKESWSAIEISLSSQRYAKAQEESRLKKLFSATVSKDKLFIKKVAQKYPTLLSGIYENRTMLFIATEMNDEDLAFFLLENGANINTMVNGVDASWLALSLGFDDLFKLYIQEGATLNHKNKGETRLIQAVKLSNVEIVRFLLNHGIKIDTVDKEGKTALHYNFLKSPYTEADKEIGAMLIATGCSPLSEDLEEIPAYGYLDDLDDIEDFYDVRSLPMLSDSKQYKVSQIKKPEETYEPAFVKEARRLALNKENKAKNPTTTNVKKPKRIP